MFYVLNSEGVPVRQELDNLLDVANNFLDIKNRRVASTRRGSIHVSTIFLSTGEFPFLWETMVFNGPLDGAQWRSDSLESAISLHRQTIERAFISVSRPKTKWGTLPGLNPDGTIGPKTIEEVVGRSVWERLIWDEDLV